MHCLTCYQASRASRPFPPLASLPQLVTLLYRSAKSTSLASKVAEQFGGAGGGMSLRHTSTAGSQAEAADSIAQAARAAPRVHRPVVRESDMRKFAGQVRPASLSESLLG